MKATFFPCFTALAILMTCTTVCSGQEIKKDYLAILKEKVGPTPYVGKVGDLQTIREDKKPGQRFLHIFNMTINGRATAMSKRLRGWWNSNSSVNFCHETNLQIYETITSSQDELNNGVVKSKFEVAKFSENLISAKAAFEFGFVSSKSILRFLKENEQTVKIMVDGAISEVEHFVPQEYSLVVTFVGGGVSLALDKMFEATTSDGYIKLPKQAVRFICRDYDSFCTKVSHLDGAVVEATWEFGKGFTDLQITTGEKTSDDDKELLTKLIYRSNPAISGRWYPAKFGSVKTVDVEEIGGMIFTSAVESDKVDGKIRIKNRGLVKSEKDKEYVVGKDLTSLDKNVKFTEIGIVENGLNSINIKAKHESIESLSASFIPHGRFFIVEKSSNLPKFVRSASIEGKFDVRIDNKKGIFQELNMDGRSGRIRITYLQKYLGRK